MHRALGSPPGSPAADLGWNNVGWHNKEMLTPVADQLVADGIELDRHYVFYFCAPTRSSMMVLPPPRCIGVYI